MRTLVILIFLGCMSFVPLSCVNYNPPTTGGKPKSVVNSPRSSGTPGRLASKTTNRPKRSIMRRTYTSFVTNIPAGARERRQDKTNNRPKKYIRH